MTETAAPISAQVALSAKTYGEFAEALRGSGCEACGLCAGRTNIVVDRGNPSAKIMVIGEAPGRNEDLTGRAFVGRGGQLFDRVMSEIGLDTNRDTIICNVAKCRPPDNRPPKPEEAAACRPFLMKQIELVRPEVILLLGATALKHIDPDRRKGAMGDAVGKFFTTPQFPGVQFMSLYHPAALLYNSKLRPAMAEHLQTVKHFLHL